jgi:acetyltransferase EpsM
MNPSPTPVIMPLLNPNEPEARLVALPISKGQFVNEDDVLCTLETTKSTADIVAETSGYVIGLRFTVGQVVRAGECLCYLAASPDQEVPISSPTLQAASVAVEANHPPGLRITRPALTLARQSEIDLNQLPVGPLVTENTIRQMIDQPAQSASALSLDDEYSPSDVLIYGGGGHAKMLIDLLRAAGGYRIAGILDDYLPVGQQVMGIKVLGSSHLLPELHRRGLRQALNAVGGIGDITIRILIGELLARSNYTFPVVVHPAAHLEPGAELAPGSQIFAHAYVGSEAYIGPHSIVNTGAIVSHDCHLEAYSILSPGAILAGEVHVGEGTLIGMGVTVNLRVSIGSHARLGNSATIKADVPASTRVRAGTIWPPREG